MNKDRDIVTEEVTVIILDSKSAVCMANIGEDTKHTRHIDRRAHFVRNSDKFRMHKFDWCARGLKLEDIINKNVGENGLNPRMKYKMVSFENGWITLVHER